MKQAWSLFIWLLIVGVTTNAQVMPLPHECKFNIGDDTAWANPSFDDSHWQNKSLGASCLTPDMKGNIYAWYRIPIFIPDTWQATATLNNGLKLKLGKIDDVDQTFLNGKLIGQTGSFPPGYQGKWDVERQYIISPSDIQWNKVNLIAVRLFSPDVLGVGMYEGPYQIAPVQWSDFITVTDSIVTTPNKGFATSFSFVNKGAMPLELDVQYWVADRNGQQLYSEKRRLLVNKGILQRALFGNYQPTGKDIFKVGYRITEPNSTAVITQERLHLVKREVHIPVAAAPHPIVVNKVKTVFTAAPFQNQQLQGYLGKRMQQNLTERLLKLDEEGTLDGYLQRPGHHPWAGEHIGKYLEAACNVWKNTGNAQLKQQMDRMMYQLVNAQLADGYLGTYTPNEYWTSWDVWSHKYNLYGLLAYYTTTGYKPALDACKKMADLLCATFGKAAGQRDIILAGTHVGMAATSILDPMVELYKYTGDKKYLSFCYYILDALEQANGPQIISRLLAGKSVQMVGNGKAYEMISNFVGITKLYALTGDGQLLKAMELAWTDIVQKKLYITGTASNKEYFQDDYYLPAEADDHIGEGCVTTTWIQFNKELFAITGHLKYLEQMEKSIYNHLLAAENPQSGCVSYYTPLMGQKPYTCNITCCQSSVPRGIALIPNFTMGNRNGMPTLLLYEPATYQYDMVINGKTIKLTLTVNTDFPLSGHVIINVHPSQAAFFPIALRVPNWCSNFTATVGNKVYTGRPNEYLYIQRKWQADGQIKLQFNMPLQYIPGGKSYPGQLALQRGPQVLAYDAALNAGLSFDNACKTGNPCAIASGIQPALPKAVLPVGWIGQQAFNLTLTGNTAQGKMALVLVPFADAGQTGGALKVWLPVMVSKK